MAAKNEFPQGNSSAGSSTLSKCSFDLEKESNPDPKPMIAGNAAIDEMKNPSKGSGGPHLFPTVKRSDARALTEIETEIEGVYLVEQPSRPIIHLDLWNRPHWAMYKARIEANPDHPESIRMRDYILWEEENRPCLDAAHLKALRPNYIPVDVVKDPRSDLPEIRGNLFHVPGEVTLDEFLCTVEVNFSVDLEDGQVMYVYFKKTQFPNDALMSEIYEENVDENGYLLLIYSGLDKLIYTPQ